MWRLKELVSLILHTYLLSKMESIYDEIAYLNEETPLLGR